MMVRYRDPETTLVTGGAGFIGTNVASRLAREGEHVRILDNLSRPGVAENARWLSDTFGDRIEIREGDVRDPATVEEAVGDAASVFHLAAQVAVTTSLEDPRADFETNLRGTLNILEALRDRNHPPPLVFTSTNKVYGDLADLRLAERDARYEPSDKAIAERGISEDRPLQFHSPYGCSKGAADQYVLDYARNYGIPGIVFRMSCIYGPHQCGTEDQGWVAHFLLRALEGERIFIYGDGKQVRDVLYVDDLVEAMLLARAEADRIGGRAFNIGGTPDNSVSLMQVLARIEKLVDLPLDIDFGPWRSSDQRWYASDVSRYSSATGWRPTTVVKDGLSRLRDWLVAERAGTERVGPSRRVPREARIGQAS